MAMDRLLERLRRGSGPPLRVSEVAAVTGFSTRKLQRLMDGQELAFVRLEEEGERRVPVSEAARLARQLRLLE